MIMAYIKHFSAVLVLLILSLSLQGSSLENSTDNYREAPKTTKSQKNSAKSKSAQAEEALSKKLDSLVKLRPGTDHRADSRFTTSTSRKSRALAYQLISKLPQGHRDQVKELTLFCTKDGRRGLAGSGSLIVRACNVTDAEFVAVLTHEIGHLVDEGFLKGTGDATFSGFYDFDTPVLVNDQSSSFYSISWNSEKEQRDDSFDHDFISLYGASDPFEDFAETFAAYVTQCPRFQAMRETSTRLAQKYEFMKSQVFGGQEFCEKASTSVDPWERDYDVTVLPYSVKTLLASK